MTPFQPTLLVLAGTLTLGLACASQEQSLLDAMSEASSYYSTMSSSNSTSSSTSSTSIYQNNYHAVNGILLLKEGEISLEDSLLTFDFYHDDVIWCQSYPVITKAVTKATPADEIEGWWVVSFEHSNNCEGRSPVELRIGIGELHPSLSPAIDVEKLESEQLFGTYIEEIEDEIWVFGVADGPDEISRGGVNSALDGFYTITTLFLLPG